MIEIENYIKEMQALGRSEASIDSVRYTLQKLAKFKSLDEITKNDLITFFTEFDGSEQSKRLYMGQIKKFYKYCNKEDMVKWIKLPKVKEKRIDVLKVDDINKMIESTISPYWKAYIAFAFTTGGRFSEIQALRWKDVPDCAIAEILTEKTSAGIRRIPLSMATTYLLNLKLQINATENDIIFPLSEFRTLCVLKDIAKAAGIKIKVHPHLFRHSCATKLVEDGITEYKLRYWMGWTATSPMPAKYIHMRNDILLTDPETPKDPETIKPAKNEIGELQAEIQILKHEHEMELEALKVDFEQKMSKMETAYNNFMKFANADILKQMADRAQVNQSRLR